MLGWLRILATRILGCLSRRPADEEFAQELESHLEMLAAENMRRGMQLEEARRAARVRLGGITQISERHREMHTLPLLEAFQQAGDKTVKDTEEVVRRGNNTTSHYFVNYTPFK